MKIHWGVFLFTLNACKYIQAQWSVEQSAVLQVCLTSQETLVSIVFQKSINKTESLNFHSIPLKPAMFITLHNLKLFDRMNTTVMISLGPSGSGDKNVNMSSGWPERKDHMVIRIKIGLSPWEAKTAEQISRQSA